MMSNGRTIERVVTTALKALDTALRTPAAEIKRNNPALSGFFAIALMNGGPNVLKSVVEINCFLQEAKTIMDSRIEELQRQNLALEVDFDARRELLAAQMLRKTTELEASRSEVAGLQGQLVQIRQESEGNINGLNQRIAEIQNELDTTKNLSETSAAELLQAKGERDTYVATLASLLEVVRGYFSEAEKPGDVGEGIKRLGDSKKEADVKAEKLANEIEEAKQLIMKTVGVFSINTLHEGIELLLSNVKPKGEAPVQGQLNALNTALDQLKEQHRQVLAARKTLEETNTELIRSCAELESRLAQTNAQHEQEINRIIKERDEMLRVAEEELKKKYIPELSPDLLVEEVEMPDFIREINRLLDKNEIEELSLDEEGELANLFVDNRREILDSYQELYLAMAAVFLSSKIEKNRRIGKNIMDIYEDSQNQKV